MNFNSNQHKKKKVMTLIIIIVVFFNFFRLFSFSEVRVDEEKEKLELRDFCKYNNNIGQSLSLSLVFFLKKKSIYNHKW